MKSLSSFWLLLCLPFCVSATVIHVPDDYDTIQAGIDAAVRGDTVLVAPGTYMGEGNKNLLCNFAKAIVLISEGGPEVTVIDCENDGNGIVFENGERDDTIFRGFTIQHGFDEYGGGIFCFDTSPSIENCIIWKNNPHGIEGLSGSPIIKDCFISENRKRGLHIHSSSLISGCTISDNGYGGIECVYGDANIYNCQIFNNSAAFGGGINSSSGSVDVYNCEIYGNNASFYGGGISVRGGWSGVNLFNCVISGNSALKGAGFGASYANSSFVYNTVITGNTAYEFGGGIYNGIESYLLVENSTIIDNESAGSGAGIWADLYSYPYMKGSIVWGNIPGNVAGPWSITFSDIQGGWSGAGNIDEDPVFVNSDDYHLFWGSPCVDASIDLGQYRDLDGDPRPLGTGYDMGADEVNPVGSGIWVAQTSYSVVSFIGEQAPDDTLLIVSGGTDTLTYSAWPETGSWLTLSGTTTGSPAPGDTAIMFLQYDPSGLGIGTHYDTVTIASDDPLNPVISIPVQLQITALELHVPEDYSTIQAAIDAAIDSAVVVVAEGTYIGTGNKNLDLLGKTITVRSESGPEQTIIDCENIGRGFYFQSGESNATKIEAFAIINGNADLGGGIRSYFSSPTIVGCVIEDNSATSNGGGLFCNNYSEPIIENCAIQNNFTSGKGGGLFLNAATKPEFLGNILSGNYAEINGGALYLEVQKCFISNCLIVKNTALSRGGGVYIYNNYPSLLVNSTITENYAADGGGMYCDRKIQITNSIIWGNQTEEIRVSPSIELDVTYSDIQGGYPGIGNIDLYPLFVSPGNGDYHLLWNSPCIDAGTNVEVYTDFDGDPRPLGAGFDMGYDEFYRDGVWFATRPAFFEHYCVYPELTLDEDTLVIVSGGTEYLTYTINPGIEPWLSITGDLAGTLAPGDSGIVNLVYNLSDMVPGSYTDTLIAVSNDPLRPEVSIPVTLDIDPPIIVEVSCDDPYVMPGEDLRFRVSLSNLLDQEKRFHAWLDLYLVNGEPYANNPVDGPEWITLEGSEVLEGPYRLSIFPGAPPGGPFSLCLSAGGYPSLMSDEACFDFYIIK